MKKSIKLVSIVLALVLTVALASVFVACNKSTGEQETPVPRDDTVIKIGDIKGKTVACIGNGAVPGLTFTYVVKNNGLEIITEGTPNENQVKIIWAADGAAANAAIVNGSADFAVVGEPAATALSAKFGYTRSMNIQDEYAKVNANNGSTYPQAGIFVKTSLAENEGFMTALFEALAASKKWVTENKADVTKYMQDNLYESAAFPPASIDRCAINAKRADAGEQARIIAFLRNIMPSVDWSANSAKLFVSTTATSALADGTSLRFAAPEGTPALTIGRLATDNLKLYGATMKYDVVAPINIATEMAAGKADIVIMPINAGSNLIVNKNADYKLVSVAVDGSLFMIGK